MPRHLTTSAKRNRIKLLDNVRIENDFNLWCYFYAFEINNKKKGTNIEEAETEKKKKKVMRKNRALRNLLFNSKSNINCE